MFLPECPWGQPVGWKLSRGNRSIRKLGGREDHRGCCERPTPNDTPAKAAIKSVNVRIEDILRRKGGDRFFNVRDAMTATMSDLSLIHISEPTRLLSIS